MKHHSYWLAGVALLLASVAGLADEKPNILLVMDDDQGWGDVGYYDHPVLKTPNLDKMAAEGLRFDRFYAAAPVCSPTRASVLTGRTPNRMGCFKWGYTLRPQEITLAERLKKIGYATGHFGKWHVGSVQVGSPVNPTNSGFDEWLSAPNFYDNDAIMSRNGKAEKMKGESSMIAADAAIDFIRKQVKEKKPFFAVVWFGSPHNPHQASQENFKTYQKEGKQKAHFLGELAGIDQAVGKLRNELQELGVRDNTLFWYCSDNGGLPRLARTGGRDHKGKVYEGGLRVPSIIEWPAKIKKPLVTNIPANTYDIYPTICELLNIKLDNQPVLDGISLAGTFDGSMTKRDKGMGFWDTIAKGHSTPSAKWMKELLEAQQAGNKTFNEERLRMDAGKISKQYPTDSFPGHAAWIQWPYKLHRIQGKKNNVKWELYNLEKDPMEKNNLSGAESEKVEELKKPFVNWLTSVVNSLNGKDYPST